MQRVAVPACTGAIGKRLYPCVLAPSRTLVVARGLQRKADEQTEQQQGLGVARAPDLEISEPVTSERPDQRLVEPVVEKDLPYLAVAAVAGMGAAETAYLTLTKLLGSSPVCPISGCETVLNSSYSELFGIPLSFLGMLAYGTVAGVAVAASQQKSSGDKEIFNKALAAGATLLSGVSAMLLYILQTKFTGDTCVWCYGSAALSFTTLGLVSMSMPPRQLASAAVPGLGALASAILVFYMAFGSTEPSTADDFELPYTAPMVTEQSTSQAVSLARRLKNAGARMYGAFWCSHCFDQKQVFGKQAMADFPYVECYPDGWKKGTKVVDACDTAGIRAFPTWIINGRVTEGQLTLEALEAELKGEPIEVKKAPKSPFADS